MKKTELRNLHVLLEDLRWVVAAQYDDAHHNDEPDRKKRMDQLLKRIKKALVLLDVASGVH